MELVGGARVSVVVGVVPRLDEDGKDLKRAPSAQRELARPLMTAVVRRCQSNVGIAAARKLDILWPEISSVGERRKKLNRYSTGLGCWRRRRELECSS